MAARLRVHAIAPAILVFILDASYPSSSEPIPLLWQRLTPRLIRQLSQTLFTVSCDPPFSGFRCPLVLSLLRRFSNNFVQRSTSYRLRQTCMRLPFSHLSTNPMSLAHTGQGSRISASLDRDHQVSVQFSHLCLMSLATHSARDPVS